MTTIDRSKFKATNVQTLEQIEKEANDIRFSNDGPRTQYHKITDGRNKFRIYPARENERSFIYAKSVHFLQLEVEYKDKDGNEKREIKNKPVFNSKIHGGTKKDIIEEYINLATNLITSKSTNDRELEKSLGIIKGYRDLSGKFHNGITAKMGWACYADKYDGNSKQFGLLEITPGCKNQMNKISAIENAHQAIITDPFTDLDDGICLIVDYNSKATKNTDYYTLSLEEKAIDKFRKELIPTPLTDEDLEQWLQVNSLESLFVKSYKYNDFEKAIKGLRYFDDVNKLNVFSTDEWHKVVDEIEAYYEKPTEEENYKKDAARVATEVTKPVINNTSDLNILDKSIDDMDRDELKGYIRRNKLGIIIKPEYNDDEIRDMIEDALTTIKPVIPTTVEERKKQVEQVEDPLNKYSNEEESPFKSDEDINTKSRLSNAKDRIAALKANKNK